MNIDACFELGFILKTHGIQGEVTFVLDVDTPEDYKGLESVFIGINGKLVPFFIDKIQITGEKAIVRLEDVNTLEKAEGIVGNTLYLPLQNLPQLDEDQFYYHDIIGYRIIDEVKGPLGIVANIYELPGQDVLAMTYWEKEVLIPITDEIVTGADREIKEVYVVLPDGLLEVYLEDTDKEMGELNNG